MSIFRTILNRIPRRVVLVSPFPGRRVAYSNDELLNGSSADMRVNASGGDIDFKLGPPTGQIWAVELCALTLVHNGSMKPQNFGALATPLAKGFQLIQVSDGVENVNCTIKNNKQLTNCFFAGIVGQGLGTGNVGYLDTPDFAFGPYKFDTPIVLVGNDNDKMIMRIRDNLSGLAAAPENTLEASIKYKRILE